MTAKTLKTHRAKLGLTQEALASQLGVTRNTVVRWEMGMYPIPAWADKFIRLLRKGKT